MLVFVGVRAIGLLGRLPVGITTRRRFSDEHIQPVEMGLEHVVSLHKAVHQPSTGRLGQSRLSKSTHSSRIPIHLALTPPRRMSSLVENQNLRGVLPADFAHGYASASYQIEGECGYIDPGHQLTRIQC
jgi:hypothetical protein